MCLFPKEMIDLILRTDRIFGLVYVNMGICELLLLQLMLTSVLKQYREEEDIYS